MDSNIYNSDELTHWGVMGMKWGVRRYQRKDGSLTPAGERKLKREREALKKEEQVLKNRKSTQAKFDRLAAKRRSLEEKKKELDGDKKAAKEAKKANKEGKPVKKSLNDMSDEELAAAIRRSQLEQQYSALTAQPETSKKGNSFVKDFWDRAAVPGIQEAGKGLIRDYTTKLGKKFLGLNEPAAENTIDALTKEWKTLNLTNKIREERDKIAEATAKATAKQAAKEAKTEAKKEARSQAVNDFINRVSSSSNRTRNSATVSQDEYDFSSRPANETKSKAVNDFINRVSSSSGNNRSRSSATVSQNEYVFSSSVSNLPAVTTNSGRSAVAGLLTGSTGRRNANEVGYQDRDGNFHAY